MKENWDNKWSQVIKSTLNGYQAEVPSDQWQALQSKMVAKPFYMILSVKAIAGLVAIVGVTTLTLLQLGVQKPANNTAEIPVSLPETAQNKELPVVHLDKQNDSNKKVEKSLFPRVIIQDSLRNYEVRYEDRALINLPAISSHSEYSDTLTLLNNKGILRESFVHTPPHLSSIKTTRSVKQHPGSSKLINTRLSVGGGLVSDNSVWNGFANLHGQVTRKKWGLYGGINYSAMRQYFKHGYQTDTISHLATTDTTAVNSSTLHQVSLYGGIKHELFHFQSYHFHINAGVYKPFYFNAAFKLSEAIKWSSGLEMETLVLKKYKVSIYYNVLIPTNTPKNLDHLIGIRLNL